MDEKQYQIDLLKAMNRKLQQSDHILNMIIDNPEYAYIYYNFKDRKLETIGDIKHFTGVLLKDIKDLEEFAFLVTEEKSEEIKRLVNVEVLKEQNAFAEYQLNNNTSAFFECSVKVVYDEQDTPFEKLYIFHDISRYNEKNNELIYMAYYDPLTLLYNRNYFVSRLNGWLENAERDGTVVSVIYINIDDFSKINYRYGIETGDELVQILGSYLKDFNQEKIMVSRFNADIFCIAIYDPCGTRSVEYICSQIYNRIKDSFLLTGHRELKISVSVGVAEFPEAAHSALKLITCAEIVMKQSKKSGKNTIYYFDAKAMNRFMQDVMVEEKLKNAVNNNALMLYYQPQYDSESNRIRGVEALLRWRDEDGSMISPAIFIPIAEKSNVILLIGDWVLNEAISTYASWKKNFNTDIILSINISTIQYRRPDFVKKLLDILDKYNVSPKDIELEVTESVLIEDFDDVINKMNTLRDFGIRISLDDFGTGFSSMNYLKGLPIDTLKIDKSFIDTITTDTPSQIITQSIVNMVKQLGFETVAEGVETKEQYDYLKNIQCDNIQGFLTGRPMPVSSIEELLRDKD